MSMNATDAPCSDSATFLATVDFPDPEPPAMPMINRVTGEPSDRGRTPDDGEIRAAGATAVVSRACIMAGAGGTVNRPPEGVAHGPNGR